MTLPRLYGHQEPFRAVSRSALAGSLPQSLLVHGPAGIGKERFSLRLGQLLLCDAPTPGGPCEECRACRLAIRLEHPDLHWFFPLPRPTGTTTPDKLREKLAELRAEELAARRADPLHQPAFDKPPGYFVATVHGILEQAALRPAWGRRKLFVLGDADLTVPQESSPEAANALLKLLEEPPPDTVLILTSHRPGALLPTILSRVLPVRLRPLADAEVESFLREVGGADPTRAARVARLALGSVARAISLLAGEGCEEGVEQGRALLAAALSERPLDRLAAAHQQSPFGGRSEELAVQLDGLELWLRDLLAVRAGHPEGVHNRAGTRFLERVARDPQLNPEGVATAARRVERARELCFGNVNPQLVIANLLTEVAADLKAIRR